MQLKNILKRNKLNYLSWQYMFYHLKHEKKFDVTPEQIKNGEITKQELLEYLYSKEFSEAMYKTIEYDTLEKAIIENKEKIRNFKYKEKYQQAKYTQISYTTFSYCFSYLKSRVDITHRFLDNRSLNICNCFVVISFIKKKINMKGGDKMYIVDLDKLVSDFGLSHTTQSHQALELGFSPSTYACIRRNNHQMSQKSLEKIVDYLDKNALNEDGFSNDINDYLIDKKYKKPTAQINNNSYKINEEKTHHYKPSYTQLTIDDYITNADSADLTEIKSKEILQTLDKVLDILKEVVK